MLLGHFDDDLDSVDVGGHLRYDVVCSAWTQFDVLLLTSWYGLFAKASTHNPARHCVYIFLSAALFFHFIRTIGFIMLYLQNSMGLWWAWLLSMRVKERSEFSLCFIDLKFLPSINPGSEFNISFDHPVWCLVNIASCTPVTYLSSTLFSRYLGMLFWSKVRSLELFSCFISLYTILVFYLSYLLYDIYYMYSMCVLWG